MLGAMSDPLRLAASENSTAAVPMRPVRVFATRDRRSLAARWSFDDDLVSDAEEILEGLEETTLPQVGAPSPE